MGAFNISTVAGDYINANSTITSSSGTSGWGGVYKYSTNTWVDNVTYPMFNWTSNISLSRVRLDEILDSVSESLREVFDRYKIFGPKFVNADVIASKAIAAQLPKDAFEFKISKKLSDGKRNVYLLVTIDEMVIDPETSEAKHIKVIVDLCSQQYGNFDRCQQISDNLPPHWEEEFSYKSNTSMVKRLLKEGRPLGELSLKDAIALSTRYEMTTSPTELEMHMINPTDPAGQKFLQKFGKEVGFKTTLAQLLLDEDKVVAAKAKEIADILLKR